MKLVWHNPSVGATPLDSLKRVSGLEFMACIVGACGRPASRYFVNVSEEGGSAFVTKACQDCARVAAMGWGSSTVWEVDAEWILAMEILSA